jgi:UDP-N-acetylglucosamine transferase subunit ALG13
MIFVTVGTHEQQFNRLIETVDNLVRDGKITEEVIMQTGYSTYKPKYCIWKSKFVLEEMKEMMNQAHIIITHGDPSSFMEALEEKKIPI